MTVHTNILAQYHLPFCLLSVLSHSLGFLMYLVKLDTTALWKISQVWDEDGKILCILEKILRNFGNIQLISCSYVFRVSLDILCISQNILCISTNILWVSGKILCISDNKLCISGNIFCIIKKRFRVFLKTFCAFFRERFCPIQKDFVYFSKHFVYFGKHILHLSATVDDTYK